MIDGLRLTYLMWNIIIFEIIKIKIKINMRADVVLLRNGLVIMLCRTRQWCETNLCPM